ncbi:MAG TPA: hypothetical protein VG897_14935 [Terriglobales bacterium]|nr:hypothetical protein [Terriglobales bacterium]
MEHLFEDNDVTSAELWRAWKEKGRRRDQANARRVRLAAVLLMSVIAAAFAVYEFLLR